MHQKSFSSAKFSVICIRRESNLPIDLEPAPPWDPPPTDPPPIDPPPIDPPPMDPPPEWPP